MLNLYDGHMPKFRYQSRSTIIVTVEIRNVPEKMEFLNRDSAGHRIEYEPNDALQTEPTSEEFEELMRISLFIKEYKYTLERFQKRMNTLRTALLYAVCKEINKYTNYYDILQNPRYHILFHDDTSSRIVYMGYLFIQKYILKILLANAVRTFSVYVFFQIHRILLLLNFKIKNAASSIENCDMYRDICMYELVFVKISVKVRRK